MIFAMILLSGFAAAFTGWLLYRELRSEHSMFFGPADAVLLIAAIYAPPPVKESSGNGPAEPTT